MKNSFPLAKRPKMFCFPGVLSKYSAMISSFKISGKLHSFQMVDDFPGDILNLFTI